MDYSTRIKERQSNYLPTNPSQSTSYSFSSLFTIPTSSQIHSFSTTPCSTHLYCGTSDGFIRRYALFPTLNGNGIDNPSITNLTMKQGGHEKPPGTDTRTPVLTGYWENEEIGEWTNDLLLSKDKDREEEDKDKKVKWGTKTSALHNQSSVYSLAVHSQELWGLSGTSKGSINLFTIRQDEGQIRHVFPSVPPSTSSPSPSTSGHSSKSPVSVLTLDTTETSFLSGGWDGRIFDWDLNTGQSKRSFLSHGPSRQISSISYRPLSPFIDPAIPITGDSPLSSTSSSSNNGIAKTLVPPSSSTAAGNGVSVNGGGSDVDADGEMELDADADGEIDDTLPLPNTTSSTTPSTTTIADPAKSVPLVGSEELGGGEVSRDCFVSTSLDGLVLVWDQRVDGAQKGVVRKFGEFELPVGMGTGKEGKLGGKDRWATSACWSPSGNQIHVSRHSSSFSTYDLRSSSPLATYTLPNSTGPITQIKAMPNGEHVVTASWDCVRLWDLEKAQPVSFDSKEKEKGRGWGGKGVEVVGGHYGGTVSAIHIDPLAKWMFTTSGNRGWEGASTENLIIHEIKSE